MELIRRFFAQIKAQLAGLTISQKLLIGLLALVMVATVFFTVIFSAKPQLVPLISRPMTAEEISTAEMALKGKYDYQVSGDKVLVPVEKAYEIRGDLMANGSYPKGGDSPLTRQANNAPLFLPDSEVARAWLVAKQNELTQYLQGFPYIDDGRVIIDLGKEPALGRQGSPPTATVNVKTRGAAELSTGQVQAIADMVCGSVSGMKREDVSIIANGQHTYHAPSAESAMPTDLVEFKKTMEQLYTAKLQEMFGEMGDVRIAVNVVPDFSSRHIETTAYDPKTTVKAATLETTHELSSADGSGAGGEPGMIPNTSAPNATANASDGGSGGRRTSSTTSDSTTHTDVHVGQTVEVKNVLPGVEMKEMTASLSFPRSYFVAIYKHLNPAAKDDPDDAKLQLIIPDKLKEFAANAKTTIGAKTDDQIHVSTYDDTITLAPPMLTGTGGLASLTGPGGINLVGQYAKQAVLAAVALLALGMMLMMVRRAVPAGVDGEVDTGVFFGGKGRKKKGAANVEQLDATDDVFGEANQGDAVLTGIELDDETLQSRKMVDEVSTMIRENPENAAALVKRWMTKSK